MAGAKRFTLQYQLPISLLGSVACSVLIFISSTWHLRIRGFKFSGIAAAASKWQAANGKED